MRRGPAWLCGASLPALLCVCSVGCAGVAAPAHPFRDPGQALLAQQSARAALRSLQAEARVDQRGQQGRIKGTVLMFVQRPASVRFDAMTQFGPAAILTSDGERFAYADMRSKRFLTGATCAKNVARLLNLPLDVKQTTLLLLGGTPVIDHQRARIVWDHDGFYRLVLTADDGRRQEIDLAPADPQAQPASQALRLKRSEVYDAKGRSTVRIDYEGYRVLRSRDAKIAMPFLVHVSQSRLGRDTLIRFKEITLDVEVPAGAFAQAPLPGMQQEEASCD
jgi:hypothetical protein